ncbi:MAG: dTDP-4-dehydrorhamnose 3,5-epimerase [Flavobacteriaceae bacterium]
MKLTQTPLQGCIVIEPTVFSDNRGAFQETYRKQQLDQLLGYAVSFVQDNQSFSKKGVLRGLHFQKGEFAQAKLVRVIQGKVLDVAVDIRQNSPTFGQYHSVELSSDNNKQLFVPRGFAHGFVVLSDTATLSYKCDNYYNKEAEGGIVFNDPELDIDWGAPSVRLIISEKDLNLPQLKALTV